MRNSSSLAWFFSVLLFLWLIWVAWILRQADFHTLESLFYTTKALIVYEGYFPKLPTVGITYPLIPFQAVLLLFPIAGAFSPVVASSLGVTVIFRYLWHLGHKSEVHILFYFSILLLFFLNPSIIYLAVSGGSYYMLILATIALLHHLLNYVDSASTYNIAMAGIFYTSLIFVDFIFIWLFLFFLPVILIITSRNIADKNISNQYGIKALFQENRLQSFFIGKSISSAFMFTILPGAAFLLYLFFNHLFTNHFFDFLDNANYNYRVIEYNSIITVSETQQEFFFLGSFNDFFISIILLAPFLFFLIFLSVREPLKLYILFIPAFIIFFDLIKENVPQITSNFYQLLIIISLFGILRIKNISIPKWFTGVSIAIMTLLTVWFNHQYFLYESNRYESEAYTEIIERLPDSINAILIGNRDDSNQFVSEDSPFRVLSRSRNLDVNSSDESQSFIFENEDSSSEPTNSSIDNQTTLRGITLSNHSFDFRFDSRIDGYTDRTNLSEVEYVGDNPDLQTALFLRQITSSSSRVLIDDATSYAIVALHGRIRDFILPYENDYVTFLSNPEEYAEFILIPSRENPRQNYDMVYNLAPALGNPDIPYRILFDNGVWMVLETVNVVKLANETEPLLFTPNLLPQEPFHSVVLATHDQSLFAQRNLRRLRTQHHNLHLIPVIAEADGFQWYRWKIAAGRFSEVASAIVWRFDQLPDRDYQYHFHSSIDPQLFQPLNDYNADEQTWSLMFGRFSREEDALMVMKLWEDFGVDNLRINQEGAEYMLLTGFYNDFTAAELIAEYLSLLTYQRVSVYEILSDSSILSSAD